MAKRVCRCEVVSIDQNPEERAGWECRCFEVNHKKMASAKGPTIGSWSPIVGGGSIAGTGNSYGQVTDPATGECFEIEYRCMC